MDLGEIQKVKQRFGIIGVTSGLNAAIDKAVQVAGTDLSILIQGESGVGKENFSHIIHQYSSRKHNTYIAVNCGAIPEGTIDSELFGHVKGAFTSATSDRKGYFEEANGGTIFLDEVGELPLSTQVRLLRVLESGEFMMVGSSKVMKTNVRVVAATNVNMLEAIAQGKFREDLYYRLNAVPILVPPLRERKEDIPLLFRKFANDFAEKYSMPVIRPTEGAYNMLSNYYWRGNIRQMKNVVEQVSILEQNREVTAQSIMEYLPQNETANLPSIVRREPGAEVGGEQKMFNSEREILYQVLFDMKKDMADMKKIVHDLISGNMGDVAAQKSSGVMDVAADKAADIGVHVDQSYTIVTGRNIQEVAIDEKNVENASAYEIEKNDTHWSNAEVYVEEENLSLVEAERENIVKALERHNGKRKYAAQDLHISERTLYRKIKEYGLEK